MRYFLAKTLEFGETDILDQTFGCKHRKILKACLPIF